MIKTFRAKTTRVRERDYGPYLKIHVNAPLKAYLDFHKWVEAWVSIDDLELRENNKSNPTIHDHCSLDWSTILHTFSSGRASKWTYWLCWRPHDHLWEISTKEP